MKRTPARRANVSPAILLYIGLCTSLARGQSSPPQAVERGHKQFEAACGFCHGADATGARAPDLVRSPLVAHDVDGNLIGEVIRKGRPEKGMPGVSMPDQQISDITAYLHARVTEALHSAHVPMSYPVEKLLTGNAEAGKAYFNGAGGCKACHSPTGDLAGVARKHSPIDLVARMLYPGGQPSTVVVTLPTGEQVSGRLLHLDEFVVGLRDSSHWYRSFSRDRVKVDVRDPLAAHRELLEKLTQADVHNLFAYLETLQ
jgi:cytochrome c oxidase cbb3-type subunit 3